MNFTNSPNMNLVLPTVGQEPGPQWATDLNSSLTIIDSHDHSSGNGIPITPSGLNISSDLSFLGNNITALRSARFSSQSSALALGTDLNALYFLHNDAYIIDGLGNQIRLTQSGSIAGASGTITGLTSPASVTYVAATPAFVFQSDVNKAANLDGGSLVLRKLTTSSNGITIAPPSALASNYSLTLPVSPPANTSFVTLSNSGVIASGPELVGGITGTNIVTSVTLNGSPAVGTNLTVPGNIFLGTATLGSNGSILTVGGLQQGGQAVTTSTGDYLLQIGNNSGANLRPAIVHFPTPSSDATGVLYGTIDRNGSIISGSGFSCTRNSNGNYTITFNQTYSAVPVVVCQQRSPEFFTNDYCKSIAGATTSNFTVKWSPFASIGSETDVDFTFIVMGKFN